MSKSNIKTNPIGKVVHIDIENLRQWRLSQDNDSIRKCFEWFTAEQREKYVGTDLYNNFRSTGLIDTFTACYSYSDKERQKEFIEFVENRIEPLTKMLSFVSRFNRAIDLFYVDDNIVVIGWGANNFHTLPKQFVEFNLFKTYDDVPLYKLPEAVGLRLESSSSSENTSEIVNLGGGVIASSFQSRTDLNTSIVDIRTEISKQEAELKNELKEIQRQADLKMAEIKAAMQVKIDELNAKKREFEVQLFGLDHQLYLLRCLLGDCVEFVQLRTGKKAPVEQPVVLYQKLRFLDEDLAKMKTVYCHNYDDEGFVEDVFASDDVVFNYFCPTEKCVTLIRISKDNHYYAKSEGNALEKFAYYNGTKIAILIRNGENLHIVWTEESRIYLKENFMYAQSDAKQVDSTYVAKNDDVITQGDYTDKYDVAWKQFFSRKFLMAILQGLVEYKGILEFPEKVSFAAPSKYIIFSLADNQIVDSRYGSLSDYMSTRNKLTKVGDDILPIMSISGSCTSYSGWGNSYYEDHSRGRGDNNRVRGCSVDDEVCKINLVEVPSKCEYLYQNCTADETASDAYKEECARKAKEFERVYKLITDDCGNIVRERLTEGNTVYTVQWRNAGSGYVWKSTGTQYEFRCIKKETFDKEDTEHYKYYVSVEKPEEWNSSRKGKVAVRSNVQIYPDEFINLTYLSSDVLSYFIENKKIGSYFGTNYAYAIKYLHKAVEFIKERENNELIKISRAFSRDVTKIPHIEFILAEWKCKNSVRSITETSAKRFVNYLKTVSDYEELYNNLIKELNWKH